MKLSFDSNKVELFVIALIAGTFLLAIFIGFKPAKVFPQLRNTVRSSHMQTYMEGIYSYRINNYQMPECIPRSGEAVTIESCKEELKDYVAYFPDDPKSKDYQYMVKMDQKQNDEHKIIIYSTAPEAKEVKITR